ncbi:fam-a protein [Plasmodium vinckei brucechwatti]|uniref:Fam-a protein n=1 Tax=Plasmodium vinckei brucechwatti TaxID=119398 RepID=A0A6V7SSS7_PLAVN|nr:fam-a protein [Plasmodium vinckei brucechwatti]
MRTVFVLLTVFTHVSNKALGSEPIPKEVTFADTPADPVVYDPDKKYEQNANLLRTDPETYQNVVKMVHEAQQAAEVMDEAIIKFNYYSTRGYNFSLYENYSKYASSYFNKYKEPTDIGKIDIKIRYPRMYDEIVNILWDPNGAKKYNSDFVIGYIIREYNPNLLMIQQFYKCYTSVRLAYSYTLAVKYKVSEDTTMIVKASANINDHNRRDKKKYENIIVKSANSFKVDVNSQEDLKNGQYKKMFVHLSGYAITKYKDHVEIIHIEAINDKPLTIAPKWYKLLNKSNRMTSLIDLDYYIHNKCAYSPKVGGAGYVIL